MQFNIAFPNETESIEISLKFSRRIRKILLDMRSTPHRYDTEAFIHLENADGILDFPYSIIHPRQNVRMPVSESIQNTGFRKLYLIPEQHRNDNFHSLSYQSREHIPSCNDYLDSDIFNFLFQ